MPLNNEEGPFEQSPTTSTVSECGHNVPATIREKLGPFTVCPSCTIDHRIADIRKIQEDLRRRDGIFASKTHPESSGGRKHKDYTRSWVKAKIHCFQDIQNLRDLKRDFPEQVEGWGVLKALHRWEQLQEEAARVPGYKYVQDSLEEPKEEEVTVLLPSPKEDLKPEVDVSTSAPITPQERNDLLEQDEEWHVVARKRKTKRRTVDLTGAVESMSGKLSSTHISDATSPHDNILQEMDDVTKRVDQRSAMGSFDLFDAIAGVEFSPTQQSDGHEVPHSEPTTSPTPPSSTPPSPTPPSPTPPSVSTLTTAHPGRSAMKGTRSAPLISRATFANETTILGSPNLPSTEKPHNRHTAASMAHKSSTFHRGQKSYHPGTWTSPEGFEKYNTSFMRMSWLGYEKFLRESPSVNKNRVLWEVDSADPEPKFESEVTKLMNKARDRKVAEKKDDGKDAVTTTPANKMLDTFQIKTKTEQSGATVQSTVTGFGEDPPIGKQQVTTPANSIVDNKTEAGGPLISGRQVDDTASSTQHSTSPPAVAEVNTKGKKTKKPNSSRITTTERKRIRMRENQKTFKDSTDPTVPPEPLHDHS